MVRCRGLRILVELLDEDYSVNRTLILSSLEGIGAVFDLQVSRSTVSSGRADGVVAYPAKRFLQDARKRGYPRSVIFVDHLYPTR